MIENGMDNADRREASTEKRQRKVVFYGRVSTEHEARSLRWKIRYSGMTI